MGGLAPGRGVDAPRDPEVEDLRQVTVAVLDEEDVLRFEIAMDDGGAVNRPEAAQDEGAELHRLHG